MPDQPHAYDEVVEARYQLALQSIAREPSVVLEGKEPLRAAIEDLLGFIVESGDARLVAYADRVAALARLEWTPSSKLRGEHRGRRP